LNQFPHHIFREYDIRGIAGIEITDDLAYRLGLAYAALLPRNDRRAVVTGRCVRLSGQGIQAAVIRGLNDAGRDVVDIGMVPTPLAYYAVHTLDMAGCIMITASHNPSNYNGFKMMVGENSLHGNDIQILKNMIQQEMSKADQAGTHRKQDVIADYIDFVRRDCKLSRPLTVVIDAGNGPSGFIAAPLYRQLGCEVIELYCEPDGNFPNHHPDPTVKANMLDLITAVKAHGADLGIAFDGDGDRIGIVDEKGEMIWGDMLLLLLARQLLKQQPGATIISVVNCSDTLFDGIRQAGGNPVMWRTGHSPIKAKMKETGAMLAGEMSGHMFFADRFYGFDDAIYAGARLMQLLADAKAPLSTLLNDVPHTVSTPEIRMHCSDEHKFELVEKAKAHFGSLGYEIIDIDGMRIQFKDGWGLLRASNTQPSLVLRFEAPNEQRLLQMRALIESWLKENLSNP
jgi:phosphomannomutase/phosphoglucomutase